MNQYDACVLGNALLDLEFEITDLTLERAQIEKGVMTLIDSDRERYLLEELDGIKHVKACGGSAANTAVLIQQLGNRVFYSCRVANDDAGNFYIQDLQEKGVHHNWQDHTRPKGVTGKCLALITPDAERSMSTFLGITEQFSREDLNRDAIKNANYLYIEGYLTASPSAWEAVIEAALIAKQHHTRIALTLSDPNMCRYFRDQFNQLFEIGVDLLFCNADEAMIFTHQSSIDLAKKVLLDFSQQFVITNSYKGSIVFDGQAFIEVAAYQTTPIDTTGAGDVYAGAFLYAINSGFTCEQAGDIASLAASKVVMKFGPRLNAEEIQNLQQHMNKYRYHGSANINS
ncbi:MAG: adenosine kinase [Legionellales bacterium]|nr:adenosine kinase [Legionellales bacterium]